ncbi:hypothetical protein ACHQM5_012272 [Ranunculus cassubicifolius]
MDVIYVVAWMLFMWLLGMIHVFFYPCIALIVIVFFAFTSYCIFVFFNPFYLELCYRQYTNACIQLFNIYNESLGFSEESEDLKMSPGLSFTYKGLACTRV